LLFLLQEPPCSQPAVHTIMQMHKVASSKKNVVRDSETTLLEGKAIPANDYIHLYDSTPYRITNGHVMRAIQVR
jgi:hypothetical protein